MNEYNMLIVGVGGQGVLKLAQMICEVALLENKNVVMSEIHGMAQRGGSVFSEVRIGDILSPIFEDGECDFLISLEPSETLRYINKIKENSYIMINDSEIIPFTVSLGISNYPKKEMVYDSLNNITKNLFILKGSEILEKNGIPFALNSFMFGAFSSLNPIKFHLENFYIVLENNFKGKLFELNKFAFDLGRDEVRYIIK